MAQPITRGTPAGLGPVIIMWTIIGEKTETVLEYCKLWYGAVQAM